MSSAIRSTPHIVIIPVVIALVAAACGGGDDSTPTSPSANVPYSQTDIRVGTGAEAVAGRRVTVHYTANSVIPSNATLIFAIELLDVS